MRAAEFNSYGPAKDVITIADDAAKPVAGAHQILVRVVASSVNPIDCAVRGGYGRELFRRRNGPEFPIRLGRDVSGYVEAVGEGVTRFRKGDAIWAGILSGGLADYAVVDEAHAALKPQNLTFEEAASMPYVALTTWSALVDHVGLDAQNTAARRIVIPRGAGGVGSFAIQLMKAWGAEVATICSSRNTNLVRRLGADIVVDYTKEDFSSRLRAYDVAYDTAFDIEEKLLATLKVHGGASYVSIVTPKINLVDQYGVEDGLKRAQALFEQRVAEQKALGRNYYWSFMQPNGTALAEIGALVDQGKIRAVVDRVYALEEVAAAHEYCESMQAQGKIVIRIGHDLAALQAQRED